MPSAIDTSASAANPENSAAKKTAAGRRRRSRSAKRSAGPPPLAPKRAQRDAGRLGRDGLTAVSHFGEPLVIVALAVVLAVAETVHASRCATTLPQQLLATRPSVVKLLTFRVGSGLVRMVGARLERATSGL
jgi:hypothetical protein